MFIPRPDPYREGEHGGNHHKTKQNAYRIQMNPETVSACWKRRPRKIGECEQTDKHTNTSLLELAVSFPKQRPTGRIQGLPEMGDQLHACARDDFTFLLFSIFIVMH